MVEWSEGVRGKHVGRRRRVGDETREIFSLETLAAFIQLDTCLSLPHTHLRALIPAPGINKCSNLYSTVPTRVTSLPFFPFPSTFSSLLPDQMASASEAAKAAVFVQSEAYEGTRIKGPDFNERHTLEQLLQSYEKIGFQANGLSRAIELIDKMVGP